MPPSSAPPGSPLFATSSQSWTTVSLPESTTVVESLPDPVTVDVSVVLPEPPMSPPDTVLSSIVPPLLSTPSLSWLYESWITVEPSEACTELSVLNSV